MLRSRLVLPLLMLMLMLMLLVILGGRDRRCSVHRACSNIRRQADVERAAISATDYPIANYYYETDATILLSSGERKPETKDGRDDTGDSSWIVRNAYARANPKALKRVFRRSQKRAVRRSSSIGGLT